MKEFNLMDSISHYLNYSPFIGLAGFLFALATYAWILKQPAGNAKMTHIASLIESGSMTFLRKEYSILIVFLILVTVLLGFQLGSQTAVCYLTGAFASMICGYIGMKAATKANVRTAQAASQEGGPAKALSVAFYGGSVMGMCVASVGLLGVAILYRWLSGSATLEALNGFAMGASSIALFARVGGGIYTKAADVGADLVGKVEAGIPEDDPRNPATIADNVGDNVGDTAGMGADIFESYVGSVIATMFIGSTLGSDAHSALTLPLLIITIGLVSSILGILSMNILKGKDPAWALRLAPIVGLAALFVGSYTAVKMMNFTLFEYSMGPFYSMILGSLIGLFIGLATEYYTAGEFSPVKKWPSREKRDRPPTLFQASPLECILVFLYSSHCLRYFLCQPICRSLRDWYCSRGYARHRGGNHDGGRLRTHFRQRRRNCRNVRTGQRSACHY